MGGTPGPYDHDGDPMFCSGLTCGCIPARFIKKSTAKTDRVDKYLPECADPNSSRPPYGTSEHADVVGLPKHLKILTIDGEPVGRTIYVVYYHMQKTLERRVVNFWIGFECEEPDSWQDAHASSVEGVNGFLRVDRGLANDILVQITQGGC